MLSKTISASVYRIDAYPVEVEVDVVGAVGERSGFGLPEIAGPVDARVQFDGFGLSHEGSGLAIWLTCVCFVGSFGSNFRSLCQFVPVRSIR